MRKVLRFILLVLNLIAALLLLLSTLAGFQPPSEFILFSMLSYGYFILLNINIAFILFWLLFKRWTFLISLAAIVLRYSFVPLFFQIGGAADVSDNATIKVMSFNAHHYNGRNTFPIPMARKFIWLTVWSLWGIGIMCRPILRWAIRLPSVGRSIRWSIPFISIPRPNCK